MTTRLTPSPAGPKPRLYGLLVGINDYVGQPLLGPLNDVRNLTAYLSKQTDFEPDLRVLTDGQATRSAVIDGFLTHLTRATPADTVLFYYSGHGTQEEADPALWAAETDGKLECLVCYNKDAVNPWDYLLADKELRYLIGKVSQTGAHVVVVADCCHSGDNTRGVDLTVEALSRKDVVPEKQVVVLERRLPNVAPQRPYEAFCFGEAVSASMLQQQGVELALPQGRHIQMAACQSDELAKEVNGEGVFTKNLLAVLNATYGQVSYQDLHSRILQYMRFGFTQQPRVYVPGEETSALLNGGFLNQPIDRSALTASASYNKTKGWLLDVGAIQGVGQQPNPVILLHDPVAPTSYPVTVNQIGTDYTLLTLSDDVRPLLNKDLVYRATVSGLGTKAIRLHVVNHGGPASELPDLLQQLTTRSQSATAGGGSETFFVFDENETTADYTLHLRNGLYYITRPADENRPLIRPVEVDYPPEQVPPLPKDQRRQELEKAFAQAVETLKADLHHLSQWQYLHDLTNPGAAEPVLNIEYTLGEATSIPDTATPVPVTKAHSDPIPVQFVKTAEGVWKTTLAIGLTNPTQQTLYCTALYLSRSFQSYPGFMESNYPLEAGKSVHLGLASQTSPTGRKTTLTTSLDEVVRQYNWPAYTESFKLLVTTEPLTPKTLAFLTLDGLPSPPTLKKRDRDGAFRDGFEVDDEVVELPKWSTQTVNLQLINPLYNMVQMSELNHMLAAVDPTQWQDSMADFALGLYYDLSSSESHQPQLTLRKELTILDEGDKNWLTDLTMAVANPLAHWNQNRQYRQNLIRYPDRVRMVAAGDSWFQYPFLLRDVVNYLSGVYLVYSVAAAGATLSDYLKDNTLADAMGQVKPAFFLLSGGGNDLLGDTFPDLIRDAPDPTKTGPERYLSDTFSARLAEVEDRFGRILRQVAMQEPPVKVLVHGYDYAIPVDGKASWLGKTLAAKGIADQAERQAVVHHLLDAFNDQLRQVAATYPNVTYLDLRKTVRPDCWYDEIHPNDKGFLSVSSKFVEQINQLITSSAPVTA